MKLAFYRNKAYKYAKEVRGCTGCEAFAVMALLDVKTPALCTQCGFSNGTIFKGVGADEITRWLNKHGVDWTIRSDGYRDKHVKSTVCLKAGNTLVSLMSFRKGTPLAVMLVRTIIRKSSRIPEYIKGI